MLVYKWKNWRNKMQSSLKLDGITTRNGKRESSRWGNTGNVGCDQSWQVCKCQARVMCLRDTEVEHHVKRRKRAPARRITTAFTQWRTCCMEMRYEWSAKSYQPSLKLRRWTLPWVRHHFQADETHSFESIAFAFLLKKSNIKNKGP